MTGDGDLNKYFWGVAIAVIGTFVVAVPVGLKYSQASLLFGFIAAVSAPIVIHRIPDKNWSIGMLVGLSLFASFPVRKLFQLDGLLQELPVILAYCALLWVIGLGWRRSWR